MNDKDITITIKANPAQFQAAMKAAAEALKKTSQQTKDSARSVKDAWTNIGDTIDTVGKKVFTGVGAVVGGLATYGLMATANVQNATVGLRAMADSTEEANSLVADMIQLVKGKPLDRMDALKAASVMRSYGRSVEDTRKDVELLGKAAVLNGGQWGDTAKIYGRVIAQGKLMTMEFDMMSDRVPTLAKSLADLNGVDIGDVRQMVIDGKISVEQFQEAMEKGLPDSIYEEGEKNISNAILSIKASFRDLAFDLLGVNSSMELVSGGMADNLVGAMKEITATFRDPTVKNSLTEIGAGISNFIKALTPLIGTVLVTVAQNIDKVGIALGILATLMATKKVVEYGKSMVTLGKDIGSAAKWTVDLTKKLATQGKTMIVGTAQIVAQTAAWTAQQAAIGLAMAKQTALTVATKAQAAAQWALNAAMSANPLGLIVIAIVAVIAALVLLWQNSETFRNIVTGAFNAVWSAIQSAFNWVKDNWPLLLAILTGPIGIAMLLIINNWDTIKAAFAAAWEFIKQVWSNVAGWFGGVWNGIVNVFKGVGSWFGDLFRGAWENIKSVFAGVGGFFRGVWNTIVSIFGQVGTSIGNAIGGAVKGVVNSILGFAENTINGFIRAINIAIDAINKVPGVNIGKLGLLNIPRLETGGIVPARPGGHVIVAGEGGEDEYVVPERKLERLVSKVMSLARGGQASSGGDKKIVVENGGSLIKVDVHTDGGEFSENDAISIAKMIWRALQAQGLDIDEIGALR